MSTLAGFACPVPDSQDGDCITLAHGDGGRATRLLIHEYVLPVLGNNQLSALGDSARLPKVAGELAFTTDSFVVSPLSFPGGDIGRLAVFGTVNDLAVAGARPLWISVALILEEGLPLDVLRRVIASIGAAAREANVQVVAGDTKVVPRGAADGMFITTSGIGELLQPVPPGPQALMPGDELLVSGPIGQHGIAILAAREDLGLIPPPASDCAPLFAAVHALRQSQVPVRCLRDATRGGVAAVLHEWAGASGRTLTISESSIPVSREVRGACELLGLDPLHLPNEGTMVLAVPAGQAHSALQALRFHSDRSNAALIGEVRPRILAPVTVRRAMGTERALEEPSGSPLPRIC